ncbi:hypothetical protein E2320_005372 [Naja naja]|nr:hypothetical protein E2320_005372 [Naja naja]
MYEKPPDYFLNCISSAMEKKNVDISPKKPSLFEKFKTQYSESDLGPISLNWFEELSSEAPPYDVKKTEDLLHKTMDQNTFKTPKGKLSINNSSVSTPMIFKDRNKNVKTFTSPIEKSAQSSEETGKTFSEMPRPRTQVDESNEGTNLSSSCVIASPVVQEKQDNKYVLSESLLQTPKIFEVQTQKCISESLGVEADPDMSWTSSLATPPTLSPTVIIDLESFLNESFDKNPFPVELHGYQKPSNVPKDEDNHGGTNDFSLNIAGSRVFLKKINSVENKKALFYEKNHDELEGAHETIKASNERKCERKLKSSKCNLNTNVPTIQNSVNGKENMPSSLLCPWSQLDLSGLEITQLEKRFMKSISSSSALQVKKTSLGQIETANNHSTKERKQIDSGKHYTTPNMLYETTGSKKSNIEHNTTDSSAILLKNNMKKEAVIFSRDIAANYQTQITEKGFHEICHSNTCVDRKTGFANHSSSQEAFIKECTVPMQVSETENKQETLELTAQFLDSGIHSRKASKSKTMVLEKEMDTKLSPLLSLKEGVPDDNQRELGCLCHRKIQKFKGFKTASDKQIVLSADKVRKGKLLFKDIEDQLEDFQNEEKGAISSQNKQENTEHFSVGQNQLNLHVSDSVINSIHSDDMKIGFPEYGNKSIQNVLKNQHPKEKHNLTASQIAEITELSNILEETDSQFEFTQFRKHKTSMYNNTIKTRCFDKKKLNSKNWKDTGFVDDPVDNHSSFKHIDTGECNTDRQSNEKVILLKSNRKEKCFVPIISDPLQSDLGNHSSGKNKDEIARRGTELVRNMDGMGEILNYKIKTDGSNKCSSWHMPMKEIDIDWPQKAKKGNAKYIIQDTTKDTTIAFVKEDMENKLKDVDCQKDSVVQITSTTEVNLKIIQKYSVHVSENELSSTKNQNALPIHHFVNCGKTCCNNNCPETLSDLTCLVEVAKTEKNNTWNDAGAKKSFISEQEEKKKLSFENMNNIGNLIKPSVEDSIENNFKFGGAEKCREIGYSKNNFKDSLGVPSNKVKQGFKSGLIFKGLTLNINASAYFNGGEKISILKETCKNQNWMTSKCDLHLLDTGTLQKYPTNEERTSISKQLKVRPAAISFKTASGKTVEVSPQALKNAQLFLHKNYSNLDSHSETNKCNMLGSSLDAFGSKNCITSGYLNVEKMPMEYLDVSQFPITKELRRTAQTLPCARPMLVDTHSESNCETTDESFEMGKCFKTWVSTKGNCISDFSTDKCMLFSTASGKPVQLSKESLNKARQLFSEIEPNLSGHQNFVSGDNFSCNGIHSVKNMNASESDVNAETNVNISGKTCKNENWMTPKCSLHFLDISTLEKSSTNGEKDSSSKQLKASPVTFSFRTASGKTVNVSQEALKNAQHFLHKNLSNLESHSEANNGDAFGSSSVAFGSRDCIGSSYLSVEKISTEYSDLSRFPITKKLCENTQALSCVVPKSMETLPELNCKTSDDFIEMHICSDNRTSNKKNCKSEFSTDNCGFFSTASGKPVQLSKESLKKASLLFSEIESDLSGYQNFDPDCNYDNTMNSVTKKEFPRENRLHISQRGKNPNMEEYSGIPCDFNTACGKQVQISQKALQNAVGLLKEFDDISASNFFVDESLKQTHNSSIKTPITKTKQEHEANSSSKPKEKCKIRENLNEKETSKSLLNIEIPMYIISTEKSKQPAKFKRSFSRSKEVTEPLKVTQPCQSRVNTKYATEGNPDCFCPAYSQTPDNYSDVEASESAKAFIEDDSFTDSEVQRNIQKSILTANNSLLRTRSGKRHLEKENTFVTPFSGQPPTKRKLLPEFDQSEKSRRSSFKSSRSSPYGIINDRKKISNKISLKPAICGSFSFANERQEKLNPNFSIPQQVMKGSKSDGFSEWSSVRALCDTPGVDPNLTSKAWVYNHYKWIVWKLAAMEVAFPQAFASKCLTPEGVLLQLKYRYDIEVDKSQRSAIKRITERDDVAGKTIILCISKIISFSTNMPQTADSKSTTEDNKKEVAIIEVTDGWYGIRAVLDPPLQSLLSRQKLTVGQKIVVHGAELVGSQDASTPLEAPESLMLKITANSTRRARWYAKLGYYHDPRPFSLPLSSLFSDGGTVGCIDVIVQRIYPIQWMEKPPTGCCVFRNNRAEQREAAKFAENRQKTLETLLAKIQAKFEKNDDKGKKILRSHALTRQQIRGLQDGAELYEAIINSADPSYMEGFFNEEQLKALNSHRQMVNDKRQAQIEAEFRKAVESAEQEKNSPCRRDVSNIIKLRIVDYGTKENSKGFSTLVYLSDEHHNIIAIQICTDLKQLAIEDIIIPSVLISATNLQWRPEFKSDIPTLFAGELSAFSSNPKENHLQEIFKEFKNTIENDGCFSKDAQYKVINLLKSDPLQLHNLSKECGLDPPGNLMQEINKHELRHQSPLTIRKSDIRPSFSLGSAKVTPGFQETPKNCKKRKAMDLLSQVPSPPPVKPICTFISPSLKKAFQPPRSTCAQSKIIKKTESNTKKHLLLKLNGTDFAPESNFVADEELAMINTQALLNNFSEEQGIISMGDITSVISST